VKALVDTPPKWGQFFGKVKALFVEPTPAKEATKEVAKEAVTTVATAVKEEAAHSH
jgi:hypothetical protein